MMKSGSMLLHRRHWRGVHHLCNHWYEPQTTRHPSALILSTPLQVPTPLPVRRGLHAWPFDMDNIAGKALDDELRQADMIELDLRMREFPEVILVCLLSCDRCYYH